MNKARDLRLGIRDSWGITKNLVRVLSRITNPKSPIPAMVLSAIALSACAPREWLLPKVGLDPPALRDFPADFQSPVSAETGQQMPGFGGAHEGEPSGVAHTPVIFIHGNTVSARYWLPAREHFKQSGYTGDELWSLGYGWDNVRYFDSGDLSVPSVERTVNSVMDYLSAKSGRKIHQVDVIGHSLGVTLVLQWMKQTNSYHKVRNFIGTCGASDGVWTAWPDARGQNRVVSLELAPNSPWLQQLRRGGETPGPTRYMTLYDGTGWADVLFPSWGRDSGALQGAYNLAYNRVHGTYFDHLELPREPETMDAMIEWLRKAPEPLPQASPPRLVQEGGRLRAEPAQARVHCAMGQAYPRADNAALESVTLSPSQLYTCYAHDPASALSSPLARYKFKPGYRASGELTLSAYPAAGVYEQAQTVALSASDPEAYIVYTTSGTPPNSGSPLYSEPVFVPGPLKLIAQAIAPDGRQSAPLELDYDISLEQINAAHTLQSNFEERLPLRYEGRRKKGR